MSKVWVVTTGEYSDFGYKGIFSTEEKAKEFHAAVSLVEGRHVNAIEEWELDSPGFTPGHTPWFVSMDTAGLVTRYEAASFGVPLAEGEVYEFRPRGRPVELTFHLWARDAAHAVKIANEKRVAWLLSPERIADVSQG